MLPVVIPGQFTVAQRKPSEFSSNAVFQHIAQAVALRAVGWSLQQALTAGALGNRETLAKMLNERCGSRPLLHASFVYQQTSDAFTCPPDPKLSVKDFFASYTLELNARQAHAKCRRLPQGDPLGDP